MTSSIHSFCVLDMSNFYLDVIKDRLYCDGADSLSRRSAQTAIYTILDAMVRLLAPLLSSPPTRSGWRCRTPGAPTRAT